jgi:hypothetical protein
MSSRSCLTADRTIWTIRLLNVDVRDRVGTNDAADGQRIAMGSPREPARHERMTEKSRFAHFFLPSERMSRHVLLASPPPS